MNICKRAIIIALRHPLYLAIYIGFLSAMGVLLMGEVGTAQAPRALIRVFSGRHRAGRPRRLAHFTRASRRP